MRSARRRGVERVNAKRLCQPSPPKYRTSLGSRPAIGRLLVQAAIYGDTQRPDLRAQGHARDSQQLGGLLLPSPHVLEDLFEHDPVDFGTDTMVDVVAAFGE